MITHEAAIQLSQRLNAANIQLAFPYRNLVDVIWKDRPVRPRDPIFIQPAEIAGTTAGVKLRNMRQWMDEQAKRNPTGTGPGSTPIAGALVASLDSIAWLLNLRGSDVPYNPLFLSYLFVSRSSTPKRTVLFTGLMKVNEEIRHYLDEIGVDVKEYNDVWNWLRRREWGDGKVSIVARTAKNQLLTFFSAGDHYAEDTIRPQLHANFNPIRRCRGLHREYASYQERSRT